MKKKIVWKWSNPFNKAPKLFYGIVTCINVMSDFQNAYKLFHSVKHKLPCFSCKYTFCYIVCLTFAVSCSSEWFEVICFFYLPLKPSPILCPPSGSRWGISGKWLTWRSPPPAAAEYSQSLSPHTHHSLSPVHHTSMSCTVLLIIIPQEILGFVFFKLCFQFSCKNSLDSGLILPLKNAP